MRKYGLCVVGAAFRLQFITIGEEKERTKAEGRSAALVSVAVTGPKNLWQNKATLRTGRSDRIIPGNAVDFPLHN